MIAGVESVASMNVLVTGGAGFIGSNLVAALLTQGHDVTAYDNLALGRAEFVAPHASNPRFRLVVADLLDCAALRATLRGRDIVFHLAANSDIAFSPTTIDLDLRQGTLATFELLRAMTEVRVPAIVFASTSAVCGIANQAPTSENYGPAMPISLYGASKLASEGLLSAFAHLTGLRVWIFRFGNIIGRNGTHGAAFDFIRKLRRNPRELEILGDGRQAKPYLHVDDCVGGMLFGTTVDGAAGVHIYNLACPGATTVRRIADAVVDAMGLSGVTYRFTGGAQGWPGDVPQVSLDTSALAALGWRARYSSDEAVTRGVAELVEQA